MGSCILNELGVNFNTNLIALKHVKRENPPLLVAIRGSETTFDCQKKRTLLTALVSFVVLN